MSTYMTRRWQLLVEGPRWVDLREQLEDRSGNVVGVAESAGKPFLGVVHPAGPIDADF